MRRHTQAIYLASSTKIDIDVRQVRRPPLEFNPLPLSHYLASLLHRAPSPLPKTTFLRHLRYERRARVVSVSRSFRFRLAGL